MVFFLSRRHRRNDGPPDIPVQTGIQMTVAGTNAIVSPPLSSTKHMYSPPTSPPGAPANGIYSSVPSLSPAAIPPPIALPLTPPTRPPTQGKVTYAQIQARAREIQRLEREETKVLAQRQSLLDGAPLSVTPPPWGGTYNEIQARTQEVQRLEQVVLQLRAKRQSLLGGAPLTS